MTPKSFPAKPRRARHATLAVMLALLMVGGAACGGGGGGPLAAKSTSTTTTAASGALAAFRQCMISHGIPAAAVPTGRGRRGGSAPAFESGSIPSTTLPPGVTQQQYRSALLACRGDLPGGGSGLGAGGARGAAFKAYTNCLQLHGAAISGLGRFATTSTIAGSTLATSGPTLQAAERACVSLRPKFNGTRATTTTTKP